MKKAYLKCQKQIGGEYVGQCSVLIECADGSRISGVLNENQFDAKGNLEVSIIGEKDEKTIVLLPKEIGESAEVNNYKIAT